MRGLHPRRKTPHPPSMLRISGTPSYKGSGQEKLLPIPPARCQPLVHMRRRRRDDARRILVPGDRDHELARMQVEARFAETRTVTINIVADNRPAHGRTMNAQLMGPAGDRLKRQPG